MILTSLIALFSFLRQVDCLQKRDILAPNALTLRVLKNETVAIPSTLYGYMWEDINHSGDGGLYGELLQNRAFQAVIPGTQSALNAWQSFNGASLSVTSKTDPISDALPNSLQVQIPQAACGGVGFENTGFWGIKVQQGWKYTGSFYAKAATFTGSITVSLKSATGTVFDSKVLDGINPSWTKFTFEFNPTASAPDVNNVLNIVVDGQAAEGKTLFFGMFSLFPPTFKGRENGMRIDLATALFETRPSVWRFPGGNNLEGHAFASRWKWNETIGPLENRPGRAADWGYANTDGLGLMEYLNWAEDLGAEPILGVWSGISIANYSDLPDWPVVPEQDLQPYIDDAINEIEFITADASTSKWAQLRASFGRVEPYRLRFVEIGNEDTFQAGSYAAYRWHLFVTALGEKFPDLEFLATSLPSTTLNPPYKKIDFHQYNSPKWFTDNAFMFDNYPRNGTQFFIGEFAVTSSNDSNALGTLGQGRFPFPQLRGSVAEAAFMTGLERNSDVVFASAYAPSLQNINSFQWTPDIITFDAQRMVKSTSYYVQQMFSVNRGTHVLATSPASTNASFPLFWVASRNNDTDTVFLKVANVGAADLSAYIFFDFEVSFGIGNSVTLSTSQLTSTFNVFSASNTLEAPNLITPVTSSFAMPFSDRLNVTFPATSVTVLSFNVPNW